jgi:hypothetical protein
VDIKTLLSLVAAIQACAVLAAQPSGVPEGKGLVEAGFIRISKDQRGFVFSESSRRFTPWGFNYDHDRNNRLLETYWREEWDAVAGDFREMKTMGANTVRIHLQVSRFMKSATEPDKESLGMLGALLRLAERTGLYLDITGLGCYDKRDVPAWYNRMLEGPRWEVQARFWEAVAGVCKDSPAVFCYDLMNEPILSEDTMTGDWTPGAFGDRHYVQRISLDFAGRSGQEVARAWVEKMVAAIRREDRRHLLTIGAIPWALHFPNAKPDFYSKEVSQNLDFVSVHFYPKSLEVKKALKALKAYEIGKPIVIEEMYPLSCSIDEMNQFIDGSKPVATGWISFYWGKTVAEYKAEKRGIAEDGVMKWLQYWEGKGREMGGTRK